MALVTSAKDITVIILNNIEAEALTDLLDVAPPILAVVLHELTDAMLSEKMAFAFDDSELGHRWGNSYDNERVVCRLCDCSYLGRWAKKPCEFSEGKSDDR